MAYNFIVVFIILILTLTLAIILIKLFRPGSKEDSLSRSWDSTADEKRQHPRIDVNWPVTIETEKGTENAVIRNIGIGGAFVVCEKPLPINETARLTIQTPLDQPLVLNGKAIWTNVSVRDDKIVNKGMRIQFVYNPIEDLKLLHQALVESCQQKLPEGELSDKTEDYGNRQDSRVDVRWPVEMETPEGTVTAETRHVSISGAFIVCQKPLPLNERFRIAIAISKQKQVSMNALVVWSNSNVPDDKIVNRGMGIKFINISKEDLKPFAKALIKIVADSFNSKD